MCQEGVTWLHTDHCALHTDNLAAVASVWCSVQLLFIVSKHALHQSYMEDNGQVAFLQLHLQAVNSL